MDLTDIYRNFHPTAAVSILKHTGTLSRRVYMIGHKIYLSKLKKTEITPSIFSDHNAMRLEISNRTNMGPCTKSLALRNSTGEVVCKAPGLYMTDIC